MQRTGGGPPHIWFWPPRPLPLPPLPHPRRGRDPEGQETSSCLRAPGWGSSFSRAPFLEFGLSLLTRPRRPPQAPHPPPLLHLHQQRLFVFFNFSALPCPPAFVFGPAVGHMPSGTMLLFPWAWCAVGGSETGSRASQRSTRMWGRWGCGERAAQAFLPGPWGCLVRGP